MQARTPHGEGLERLLPGDGPGVPRHVAAADVHLCGWGALADAAFDDPVRGGRALYLAALLFGFPLLGRCDRCVHGAQAHDVPGPDSVESGLSTQHSSVATHAPRENGAGTPVRGSAQRQAARHGDDTPA